MLFKALLLVSMATAILGGRKKYDKYDGFLFDRNLVAATIGGYSTYRRNLDRAYQGGGVAATNQQANNAPVPGRQRGFILRSNANQGLGGGAELGGPIRPPPPPPQPQPAYQGDRIQGSYSNQQPAAAPTITRRKSDISSGRNVAQTARLADLPKLKSEDVPAPYHYGYDIANDHGAKQYRKESSDGKGTIKGSYGYTDPFGVHRHVDYVADEKGFRAIIRSNEPGMGNQHPSNVALHKEKQ